MTFLTRLKTVVKLRHAAADLSLKSTVAWWPDLDWRELGGLKALKGGGAGLILVSGRQAAWVSIVGCGAAKAEKSTTG